MVAFEAEYLVLDDQKFSAKYEYVLNALIMSNITNVDNSEMRSSSTGTPIRRMDVISRGDSELRNETRWGGIKNNFKNIDDFKNASHITDGLTTIDIESTFVDIYTTLKPGRPLYVYFQGAQRRLERNIKLPIFSGNKVHPEECSRLAISDPALHITKEITLGWYAGSKEFATQKVIVPTILNKIISLAKASTIVFIGGSGGGFASLCFSRAYPNSIALVCNPQTNILKYWERLVREFLKTCYDFDNIELAAKNPKLTHGIVKNLCWLYKADRGELHNRIIYMQNINDRFHYERHYKKFSEALGAEIVEDVGFRQQGNFMTLLDDWGGGHTAAPGHVWHRILKNISLYEDRLDDIVANNEAERLING